MSITKNKTVTCYSCGKKLCPLLQQKDQAHTKSLSCSLNYDVKYLNFEDRNFCVISNECKLSSITIKGKTFKPKYIISEKGKADV